MYIELKENFELKQGDGLHLPCNKLSYRYEALADNHCRQVSAAVSSILSTMSWRLQNVLVLDPLV
jgi:hypothetical protein